MSAATSPGTGLAYGLRRVCAAWGMARSSFYAMTSGQHAEPPPAKRRGPKPAISDQALLVAIEADLEASPWEGEGYRKVWARLRVCRDIRVARKRVLRLMRENNLLSPHRCRRRGGNPHDGEIITHAPNLMWGTDGVRVFTVDDGWGWIFTAVEHWNAECVGWHVCKRGDRFAALQPISMGLAGLYGSTAAGAARGLALRMDHGSQYLSDHFTNQIKFWGIQPSYAFVAEPQTNGVAERFNRTLKEQIIHGRIYRNIAELRDAVRDFVELYNAQWIVEKNGYLSPAQARQVFSPRLAEHVLMPQPTDGLINQIGDPGLVRSTFLIICRDLIRRNEVGLCGAHLRACQEHYQRTAGSLRLASLVRHGSQCTGRSGCPGPRSDRFAGSKHTRIKWASRASSVITATCRPAFVSDPTDCFAAQNS